MFKFSLFCILNWIWHFYFVYELDLYIAVKRQIIINTFMLHRRGSSKGAGVAEPNHIYSSISWSTTVNHHKVLIHKTRHFKSCWNPIYLFCMFKENVDRFKPLFHWFAQSCYSVLTAPFISIELLLHLGTATSPKRGPLGQESCCPMLEGMNRTGQGRAVNDRATRAIDFISNWTSLKILYSHQDSCFIENNQN